MSAPRTKLTIQAIVNAPTDMVWATFTDSKHITHWNSSSEEWHTAEATIDVRVGGGFVFTIAKRNGSHRMEFAGEYAIVEGHGRIEYRTLEEDRIVCVEFKPHNGNAMPTLVTRDVRAGIDQSRRAPAPRVENHPRQLLRSTSSPNNSPRRDTILIACSIPAVC